MKTLFNFITYESETFRIFKKIYTPKYPFNFHFPLFIAFTSGSTGGLGLAFSIFNSSSFFTPFTNLIEDRRILNFKVFLARFFFEVDEPLEAFNSKPVYNEISNSFKTINNIKLLHSSNISAFKASNFFVTPFLFLPFYYGYFFIFIYWTSINKDKFEFYNYLSFYLKPFYVSALGNFILILLIKFKNFNFLKKFKPIFLFFIIIGFINYIFFFPLIAFIILGLRLLLLIIQNIKFFLINPIFRVLQNFSLYIFNTFEANPWFKLDLDDKENQVDVRVWKERSPVKTTVNVKPRNNNIDLELDLPGVFIRMDFIFFITFSKFLKNLPFHPYFSLIYTKLRVAFKVLNKRFSLFLYENKALDNARLETFPEMFRNRFNDLRRPNWLFRNLSFSSSRTHPYITFIPFFEYFKKKIYYYFSISLINIKNLNYLLSAAILIQFIRKKVRIKMLIFLRFFIFAQFNNTERIKKINFIDKAQLFAFEKKYYYESTFVFYNVSKSINLRPLFKKPYSTLLFINQEIYKKLFFRRLLDKKKISFTNYAIKQGFNTEAFKFDPFFVIFTNFYIFNIFFPIFSYLGFDYMYDKNLFRDQSLYTQRERLPDDYFFHDSSSSDFKDFVSEDKNYKWELISELEESENDVFFQNTAQFDLFYFYDDFSHLAYFFGHYTDFFFKFVFWPKLLNHKIRVLDSYHYFTSHFYNQIYKYEIIDFFFKFFYFDRILAIMHFFFGFGRFLDFTLNMHRFSIKNFFNKLTRNYPIFTFFFHPFNKFFRTFYFGYLKYTNIKSVLDEHSDLTEDERSFDLGHTSEDYTYGIDLDFFRLEEDIATDYTNHLLEQHFYSTYVDEDDFLFLEFDAFDSYVFDEDLYEPLIVEDEAQIAIESSYDQEFELFFGQFESSQYEDLDENFYKAILDMIDTFLLTFYINVNNDASAVYIDDDIYDANDESIHTSPLTDAILPETSDDVSTIPIGKKNILLAQNYITLYSDHLSKWMILNKNNASKYTKLPPFFYGIGRYYPLQTDTLYHKIFKLSKFNMTEVFADPAKFYFDPKSEAFKDLFFSHVFSKKFINDRFSSDISHRTFLINFSNLFNLPIFLLPRDPYLSNFILTHSACKVFSIKVFELPHFQNQNTIKFKTDWDLSTLNFIGRKLANFLYTRTYSYYFSQSYNRYLFPLITFLYERVFFFFKKKIVPDAVDLSNPEIKDISPQKKNVISALEIPDQLSPVPRLDEWMIYKQPSIMDIPYGYGSDPQDNLWFKIYFRKKISKYKPRYLKILKRLKIRLYGYSKDFDIDYTRPRVLIRALNKSFYEDEHYSYIKRIRRRLYEIRNPIKYDFFIKNGYRVEEILVQNKKSDLKKIYKNYTSFNNPRFFYNLTRKEAYDWTSYPEFQNYQALENSSEIDEADPSNFIINFPILRVGKFIIKFNRTAFKFLKVRRKFFFKHVKKIRVFSTVFFSSYNAFNAFSDYEKPYKIGNTFDTFYIVYNPLSKDINLQTLPFMDFERTDNDYSHFFFKFFSNLTAGFYHYRIIDSFLFPYQYIFPFGNFFYDHELFDHEDETQDFSMFDFYVLEERLPNSFVDFDNYHVGELDSGIYSDLVDVSFDDSFDDIIADNPRETDKDNSSASFLYGALGSSRFVIEENFPVATVDADDLSVSNFPFDITAYDNTHNMTSIIEFDEGYYNAYKPEIYEIAVFEELVCQLYEKYMNIISSYPVDLYPAKFSNLKEFESAHQIDREIKFRYNLKNPRQIDDLFNEFKGGNGPEINRRSQKLWGFEEQAARLEYLKYKKKRFNFRDHRLAYSIVKNLQKKYQIRYPKTVDPYYFRRFELFLDDFFNLPDFRTGNYFNIFKVYIFARILSEQEIFEYLGDSSNSDFYDEIFPYFYENLDFENDTLDPDAFEFWAETTVPIARFFFGYSRVLETGEIATDPRLLFTASENLSKTNHLFVTTAFSETQTAVTTTSIQNAKLEAFTLFKKLIFYTIKFAKISFIWFYYYYFLFRPEILAYNNLSAFYINHFKKYDSYYSVHYFQKLYTYLYRWNENFSLNFDEYKKIEFEYLANLQNPSVYPVFNSKNNPQFGASSPYLINLLSKFDEPEFEYYFENFFIDNEQISIMKDRSFKHHYLNDSFQFHSPFTNITNTFFFWNYDEFFYEELIKLFDETAYDHNISQELSPNFNAENLNEESLDETIDFSPIIEELYTVDKIEFDTKYSILFEFFDETVEVYFEISLDYLKSFKKLVLTSCIFIQIKYEQIWLRFFIKYGFFSVIFRTLISFSFFICVTFYLFFIVPYLIFFYLPFSNYFFFFAFFSFTLFFFMTILFYLFSKIFRNFYKTLSAFEFEVFILTLICCWFEHIYFGYYSYPPQTVGALENPLFYFSFENDLNTPYKTMHYKRLNERSYSSYWIQPIYFQMNFKNYRQVDRSIIFSPIDLVNETYLKDGFIKKVPAYSTFPNDTEFSNRINFYPTVSGYLNTGDLTLLSILRGSDLEEVIFIDLNRISPIKTFDEYKKTIFETFLPIIRQYYVFQTRFFRIPNPRHYNYIIRRYQNRFGLSFGNNNRRSYTRKSDRYAPWSGRKLKPLPGRVNSPLHKLYKYRPKAYSRLRKKLLAAVGPKDKFQGLNFFPYETDIRRTNIIPKYQQRRNNRYNPFFIEPNFPTANQPFSKSRDLYSAFPYTLAKFLNFSDFTLMPYKNFFFKKNYKRPAHLSNYTVNYYRSTGSILNRYINSEKKKALFSHSNYVHHRGNFRKPDRNKLKTYSKTSTPFVHANLVFENQINFAAKQHVKRNLSVKNFYYNKYRVGSYAYWTKQPYTYYRDDFAPHMQFSLDFNTLYYHYTKQLFKIGYANRKHFYTARFQNKQAYIDHPLLRFLLPEYLQTVRTGRSISVDLPLAYFITRSSFMKSSKKNQRLIDLRKSVFSWPKNKKKKRSVDPDLFFSNYKKITEFSENKRIRKLLLRFKDDRNVRFTPFLFLDKAAEIIMPDSLYVKLQTYNNLKDQYGHPAKFSHQTAYSLDITAHPDYQLIALYPKLLEPMMYYKNNYKLSIPSQVSFFQLLLINVSSRRNIDAQYNFQIRQHERARLNFTRFVYNKKDFFSRFSFYDISPIYTVNSPLSHILINDFFGFNFFTKSANSITPPVTEPFFYLTQSVDNPHVYKKILANYMHFNHLYSTKAIVPVLGLNMINFQNLQKYGRRPNLKKLRIYRERIDLVPYLRRYDASRFLRYSFDIYGSIPSSEAFFIAGGYRNLRESLEIGRVFDFNTLTYKLVPTRSGRRRFSRWSINVNSKVMLQYFINENLKYETFTRNMMFDSPYIRKIAQQQPPLYVSKFFKKIINARYRYPFLRSNTLYKNYSKFIFHRPERTRGLKLKKKKLALIRAISLNRKKALHRHGAVVIRRWEDTFKRHYRASAFRAFFEFSPAIKKKKTSSIKLKRPLIPPSFNPKKTRSRK